ncbi:hypothetical protein CR513_27923, partial [Mucuna pruriens]
MYLYEHSTDMCPTLQETESDNAKIVGSIGGYQYGRQPIRPRDLDPCKAYRFRTRITINNRFQNTKYQHSNNNNNNRFHHRTIHLLWNSG